MGNQCGCDADLNDILQYDHKLAAPTKMKAPPPFSGEDVQNVQALKTPPSEPKKTPKYLENFD